MKKIILSFIAVIMTVISYSQESVTTSNVNFRDQPNLSGNVISTIPKGTNLYLSSCSNGWCSVEFDGYSGYISEKNTRLINANEIIVETSSDVNYYTNSYGHSVQSPTYYDKIPSGATAQCQDGTYSFSENRRGTCSHHGGVKRWLR